ncbi:MAG: hypothetical protein IT262_01715 [Saprospiraceae bacterium]|nr:hypothetical protein [Saprospiraceae bacterium]
MSQFKFAIILSASVPKEGRSDKFLKIPNAQIQIEEAIIGLARNVFENGGRLIFGGHPSISPLVAMVATEFDLNQNLEDASPSQVKHITIYQSKAFESIIADKTRYLSDLGYAQIIWTDTVDNEDPEMEFPGNIRCPKSLEFMRREMMKNNADAMVVIGGMEGVEQEFELFREQHANKPIYLFEKTGGAAKELTEQISNYQNVIIAEKRFEVIDTTQIIEDEPIEIIPFSLITGLIVEEILNK